MKSNGKCQMKTNHLFYIATTVIGLLMIHQFQDMVAYSAPSDSEDNSSTNISVSATNKIDMKEGPSIPTENDSLYKTITDQQSGQFAIVNANKDIVTLMNKAGGIIWSTNVIKGIQSLPFSGETIKGGEEIKSMHVYKGDLWVGIGRGYIVVDLESGGLKGIASN